MVATAILSLREMARPFTLKRRSNPIVERVKPPKLSWKPVSSNAGCRNIFGPCQKRPIIVSMMGHNPGLCNFALAFVDADSRDGLPQTGSSLPLSARTRSPVGRSVVSHGWFVQQTAKCRLPRYDDHARCASNRAIELGMR